MSATGRVALVTLIRSSKDDFLSADELAEQIRRKLESSQLSSTWTIDRVTVLDETAPRVRVSSKDKPKKIVVA